MKLKLGDPLPDFSLKNQDNQMIRSQQFIGKNLILFFYPKNETPVCTIEACAFEENYNEFQSLDAEVVGISGDSVASHKNFAKNRGLTYNLLSDEEKEVQQLFGIKKKLFGLSSERTTFIFDNTGHLVKTIESQLNGKKHIKESLLALKAKHDS